MSPSSSCIHFQPTSCESPSSPPTLLPRPSPSSSPRPPPPSSSPPSPPFLWPFQSIPPRPLHVHFSHVSSSCHFFLDPSCNSRRHPSGLHLFITLFLEFHIFLLITQRFFLFSFQKCAVSAFIFFIILFLIFKELAKSNNHSIINQQFPSKYSHGPHPNQQYSS